MADETPAPCACADDDRETFANDVTRRYECLTCWGDIGPYEDPGPPANIPA